MFLQLHLCCCLDFGGVAQCEMLYSTNVFAIIAGGRYPKYSQNTVLIHDAISKKFVMEINCSSAVKAVRLRRNKLVYNRILYLNRYFILVVCYM